MTGSAFVPHVLASGSRIAVSTPYGRGPSAIQLPPSVGVRPFVFTRHLAPAAAATEMNDDTALAPFSRLSLFYPVAIFDAGEVERRNAPRPLVGTAAVTGSVTPCRGVTGSVTDAEKMENQIKKVARVTGPGHGPDMDRRTLSPRQAATRAKCGRSSIMRALSSGDLKAIRDNSGNWQISPEALDDWLSLRRSPDRQSPDQPSEPPLVTPSDTPETLIKLAVAEARLADMTAERDRLAALLEKALEARSVGLFARLFGRR